MDADRWLRIKPVFNSAAELPPGERAAFIRSRFGDDESLAVEVESLIAAYEQAGSFIESPPTDSTLDDKSSVYMIGRRIGAYEVTRGLGRGGMGTVYLASRADDEFRKNVAIKLLRNDSNHGTIIRLFKNERQILAALDHPNIARLLDGGTTEDDSPYLVMEYVEGKPIREYCDAHRLTTNERLKLFQAVCSAVHYSHQNLIVHRDIKPNNILITEQGNAKLLDFGIAKLIGASAAFGETTIGTARVMTPEYASPEQVRGEAITTASDIYSLGVLLYELLSGRRPYRIDTPSPLEVIRAVCEQDPEKPSTAVGRTETTNSADGQATLTPEAVSAARDSQPEKLRRQLEGDLDNIVLKAMRKEPQRRYASVEQLSEDIRRYLEGLPVIARKDTFSYRTGKFIRRNKIGVAVAATILLLLALGVAGIARQTVIANRQRARAENRFNQVRKLANLVVFDYHDKIEKLPGSTPVREKMIKDAIEYLDALSAESRDDSTLQQELASAYEKIGDVQGNPYFANLGDRSGALDSYRKALAMREALHDADPADESRRDRLGNAYKNVADILWGTGASKDSLANYQKALSVFTELSTASPENREYRYYTAISFNGIGHAQEQMGESNAALDSYRQMLANDEALMSAEPSNVEYRRDVGIAKMKVGDSLKDLGIYQESLTCYQQAAAILLGLSSDKNNARASRDLALVYLRLASVHRKLNQLEKAIELQRKAVDIQSQISDADPQNAQARFDLAASYANLGDAFRLLKKLSDAEANERKAIGIFEEALKKEPVQSQPRVHLGVSYQTLGEILLDEGNLRGALESCQKSLSILEAEPIRRASAKYLVEGYVGIGDVYLAMRNWKAAKDSYEKCLAGWRELEQGQKLTDQERSKVDEVIQKIEKCNRQMAT